MPSERARLNRKKSDLDEGAALVSEADQLSDEALDANLPDWLLSYSSDPTEVASFCTQHDILGELKAAVDLATDCFGAQKLEIAKDIDPETGEEWIMMRVSIKKETNDSREAHKKYLRMWVSSVQWPKRYLVRIGYNFV